MTALEEALSRALAARANAPAPEIGDLAGRAIAAARAQRRLRYSGAAAIVICAIVAASVLTIRHPIQPAHPLVDGHDLVSPGEFVAAVSSPEPPTFPDIPVDYVLHDRLVLRNGKIVNSAVDVGFNKAFITIIDTHVTTIVSSVFLFVFGTGPIRGFAVTLVAGLLANLFTAVFVSRTIFMWHLNRQARVETLSI